ncbi:signal recognition particle-docking protein FtsY [Thiomicrospira sp. WB1]|uniref:signal recognition particle-docking protein FtsY n=1 Tax=Thiomicrospira sp. WB1 TaxID=1685380 RepID=UPI0007489341|nr:signal recognition particle-docking protein FtsY [Thiomicrospira sp. WB1]KUJ71304.1 signal recognition particle-docking protein FtsY [Thiomicrospira sp. WB1]
MLKLFKRKKDTDVSNDASSELESTDTNAQSHESLTESTSEPSTAIETAPAASEPKQGLFARLKSGLSKTRKGLSDGLASLVLGRKEIDDDLLDELEMILLSADIGIEATDEIIENLTDQVSRKTLKDPQALIDSLKTQLCAMLEPVTQPLTLPDSDRPYVILMVGVNGVGKTTTIGKLAKKFQQDGQSVMLAAGDTFRAAAVEQLQTWGERHQVPVMAQKTGADSAAVIFDAIQSASAKNMDVLIADTAGRLHTQSNLMEELKKVKRVMQKVDDTAPHEIMLVLDAGNGQNALSQAKQFHEAVGVTGLTLTKLDGTAKGGIIVALSKQLGLPVRFIGVGESADDLRPFDAKTFVDALFARDDQ